MNYSTPQKSEDYTLTFKQNTEFLIASVMLAFERTSTKPERVKDSVRDILNEFPDMNIKDVVNGIKKGSLGHYGQCYKVSTLQMCYWIRKHKEEIKHKDLNAIKKTQEDYLEEENQILISQRLNRR